MWWGPENEHVYAPDMFGAGEYHMQMCVKEQVPG